MASIDIMQLFSQLVFPVAVAAYLLWERTNTLEKLKTSMVENKIALYLVLAKLDCVDEYERKLAEYNKNKEK